jgi:hypothetical protein
VGKALRHKNWEAILSVAVPVGRGVRRNGDSFRMTGPLYDFVEEDSIPAFKLKALKVYERFLNSGEGMHKIAFDLDYVAYLKTAQGRALGSCWFRDYAGRERRIDRIFSYASKEDLKGDYQASWRHGAGDIRLDCSVPYFESLMPNWEENGILVPFAGVGANESAAYDMLCFHFQFTPAPLVILWEHEENAGESEVVHFVAKDFADFTKLVFAKPE